MAQSIRVSTFENLVKPIADPSAGAFVRQVISGYFLTFSNLDPQDTNYRFMVVLPKWTAPGAPGEAPKDREFTTTAPGSVQDPSGVGNHNTIYDITGGTSFGQTLTSELVYLGDSTDNCTRIYISDLYELCKGATAQLALLPFLGPGPNLLANGLFEVRGWLGIGIYPSNSGSELAASHVLLNPEQRGTFLPIGGTMDVSEVSQLNTSLPTASGRAENSIPVTGGAVPKKVQEWAEKNGISLSLIAPFSNLLLPVV